MDSIGELIRTWMIDSSVPDTFYCHLLPVLWPGVAGERLARNTLPGPLQAGRLTVYVRSSYWKSHLAGMETEICRRLGEVLPAGVIQSVELAASPRRFQSTSTVCPSSPEEIPAEDIRWAEECARPIDNPHLREQFRQALLASLAGHRIT
jgi:hypothetical protein